LTNISVILPCRNEEKNIANTLEYLLNQSIKPNEVVIVDNASTDYTFEIISNIAKENNWTAYRREKNDERYLSIVNSLKISSTYLKKDFDYLLVLDGDTLLEPKYFEKILKKFESEPNLGIAGGSLKSPDDSNIVFFMKHTYNVFGSNRIYSKKCWFAINEGKDMKSESVTWDTEHSVLAEAKGFVVKRFDDVFSESIRPTSNIIPTFTRGNVYYQFGYGFVYSLLNSIITFRFDYLRGYFSAKHQKLNQIGNKDLLKIIKKQNDGRLYRRITGIFSQ